MIQKILIRYHTLKYLKPVQIYYRLFYFIRKRIYHPNFDFSAKNQVKGYPLSFFNFQSAFPTLSSDMKFCFLNKEYTFKENVDWNFKNYGKLWTYNLNYFDYLLQTGLDKKQGLALINDYCKNIANIKDGLEPYPISLRGINWIKFLSVNKITDTAIEYCLYLQYKQLEKNLEYHLLANHLLENAFSLLFAAYYFQDEAYYQKAKKILHKELNEQILDDGAHFELSPMYHQILLQRLLDAINLVQNNPWKSNELNGFMISKASLMLAWLKTMSWQNALFPLFNDAANGIAPGTSELMEYAAQLSIKTEAIKLNESGYRKFSSSKFEMIVDVGKIGPSYQPGHAHADTFNFELFANGKQIIVDTGTSTYEAGKQRLLERGTSAHNTVEMNGLNQSQIWASHRVGKRAKVKILEDIEKKCLAVHDGYKNIGIFHQRTFIQQNESKISIEDQIKGYNQYYTAIARIHLHPEVEYTIENKTFCLNNSIKIIFENAEDINVCNYFYAPEFNKLIEAKCIEVKFKSSLKTIIDFETIIYN
ncbi:MAG: alginate lyase family protein [Bacteroidota bacterium]